MGLSWDITKCDRLESEMVYDEQQGKDVIKDEFWPKVEATIWGMMSTGVGWELTDANAGKFYARYRIVAKLWGYDPLEMSDVYKMVGLRTNTSPETDAAWRKRVIDRDIATSIGQFDRFVAELDAAKEDK